MTSATKRAINKTVLLTIRHAILIAGDGKTVLEAQLLLEQWHNNLAEKWAGDE